MNINSMDEAEANIRSYDLSPHLQRNDTALDRRGTDGLVVVDKQPGFDAVSFARRNVMASPLDELSGGGLATSIKELPAEEIREQIGYAIDSLDNYALRDPLGALYQELNMDIGFARETQKEYQHLIELLRRKTEFHDHEEEIRIPTREELRLHAASERNNRHLTRLMSWRVQVWERMNQAGYFASKFSDTASPVSGASQRSTEHLL